MQFSQVTSGSIEALVSVKRIYEFLRAEDLQEDAVKRIEKQCLSIGDEILSIKGGAFQWTRNGLQPTLEGINLSVRKGELVGILGRVGAGKVCPLFPYHRTRIHKMTPRAVCCPPLLARCGKRKGRSYCPVKSHMPLRIHGMRATVAAVEVAHSLKDFVRHYP